MDARKEIDRLYALEYGRFDAVFRFSAAGLAALVLHASARWGAALVWLALYGAAHLVYFTFLRLRRDVARPADLDIAAGLFLLIVLAFLWMPVRLLIGTDPAGTIAGAAGFGALLVFLIHRADTALSAVLGQIGAIALAASWVIWHTMLRVPDAGARCAVAVAAATLILYFAITLLATRRQRLEAEAASHRLVQAQKMEAIGQLAGGVAHDFNNILTAVIGNLDLYEVLEGAGERDDCVAEARSAAHRAADLVRQLLSYSRRSPMIIAAHEVGALLEQVRIFTRRLLPAAISLHLEPPATPVTILVDQNQFITAIVGLVVNARDAMPKGGKLTLRAATRQLETAEPRLDGTLLPAGTYAAITVEDTGRGIPPEILRRVTEPFFTTKEVGQGSGLGLSMVEGFARQSGGNLVIDSTPEGTRVTLLLPCATADHRPAPPEADGAPALRLVS